MISLRNYYQNRQENRPNSYLNSIEKRQFFRLDLQSYNLECRFYLINIGEKYPENIRKEEGKGYILDISGGGLNLLCDFDFPIRQGVFLEIHFKLENQAFFVKGQIIRKLDTMTELNYGVRFVNINEIYRSKIIAAINTFSIRNKKVIRPI